MRGVLSLCFVVALGLRGDVIDLPVQTYDHAVGNGSELTLWFSPFDDLGGTRLLTAVTLTLDASLSAHAVAENLSALGNTLTLQLFGGQVQASAPGGLTVTAGLTGFLPVQADVAPADGVSGSGLDYHDFGTVSTSVTGVHQTITANLGTFAGPGLIAVPIDAGGAYLVSGTGAYSFDVSITTSGRAYLSYTFEHAPEPGAGVLLALGAALCAVRRRSRRGLSR